MTSVDSSGGQLRVTRTPAVEFRFGLIFRLVGVIAVGLRRLHDYDHLAGLPDHLLNDIGVTREDVARARASAFAMPRLDSGIERADRRPITPSSGAVSPDYSRGPGTACGRRGTNH